MRVMRLICGDWTEEPVPVEAACPDCGERQASRLKLDFDASVECASCGLRYYLPGTLKRLVSDAVKELTRESNS